MTDQELRQLQWDAAQRYISGQRDHYLTVDWKSVRFWANWIAEGTRAKEETKTIDGLRQGIQSKADEYR
jgi:hypothetical protein